MQWRYITTTEGGLLRFNRFTGAEEVYDCETAGLYDLRALGVLSVMLVPTLAQLPEEAYGPSGRGWHLARV
jgi:hypothetical protein